MKESISNSVIFGIVITFFAILVILLATSSSYTKAYKVKNRIIEMIEENQGFENGVQNESELTALIDDELSKYGYRANNSISPDCSLGRGVNPAGGYKGELISFYTKYNYCVYKYTTDKGIYYGVLTYMYFDIPLVDQIKIGIYGETKTLFDLSKF